MLGLMPNHFDAESEAIVAEPFTYAGQAFKVKQVFPHKPLGVEVNTTLYGLWKSGRIVFDNSKPASTETIGKEKPGDKKKGSQPNA